MNWNTVRLFFLSTYWERRNVGSLRFTWVILGLAAVAATVPMAMNSKHAASMACGVFAAVASLAGIIWWVLFVANAKCLCSPQNNQLLPGMLRAVTWAFGLAWFMASLLFATLLSVVAGHFILCFLMVGAAFLILTWAFGLGHWWIGMPFLLIGSVGPYLSTLSFVRGLLSGDPLMQLVAILVLAAALVWTIGSVFGQRGDQALHMHDRMKRGLAAMSSGAVNHSSGRWLRIANGQALYFVAFDHALKRYKTANVGLLRYGFGSGLHWSHGVAGLLDLASTWIVVTLMASVSLGLDGARLAADMGTAFAIIIGITPLIAASAARMALYRSRREQAVMRLMPGVPQGRALNQFVARTALRRFVISFLGAVVAVAILSWCLSCDVEYAMLALVSTLPVTVWLVGDYAAMKAPAASAAVPYIFCSLVFAALVGMYLCQLPSTSIVVTATSVVLGSTLALRRRWKIALNALAAMPVGRLASAK